MTTAGEQIAQESGTLTPGFITGKNESNAPKREVRGGAMTALTVLIAGVLGLAFALLMPPFQFNDEHAHFARSYQISRGDFAGRPDPRLPSALVASLQRYPTDYVAPPGRHAH